MQSDAEVMDLIKQALSQVDPKRQAEFTEISNDQEIAALGLDSIAIMEMVNFIEEKIDTTFPDNELHKVQKIGDLAGLIKTGKV
ncbi:MAG: acyl carrier protein [Myxococcota bacterium]